MFRRVDRVNELLRQEISQLLVRHVKDPRLNGVITITEVKTSGDMRNALVLLSVLGDEETQRNALDGMQSAATFLRRELRDRLSLRYVPFFKFALDDSMEHGDRLLQIMNQIPTNQNGAQLDESPRDRSSEDGYHNNVQ